MFIQPAGRVPAKAFGLTSKVITPPSFNSLVTVACGNSISAQSKYQYGGSSGWTFQGELHVANTLCDAAMRFKLITASTRTDRYGVYGYSGAQLDAINADIAAEWIAPINTAGVTPDLVVGLALTENDIASSVATATIQARLVTWLSAVQAAWPGAKILICTPRPSFSNSTVGQVATFQAITSYIMGLDDNSTIFSVQLNGYENPASPGVPLSGYTDASVHPNAKGALVNARAIASRLRHLGSPQQTLTASSANRTFTGSTAATGSGVSGTMPTGCSFSATSASAATLASTATAPGWKVLVTPVTPADPLGVGFLIGAVNSAASPANVSAFVKLRIRSGGEYMRNVQLEPRITDGGGATFRNYLVIASADVDPGWQTGDVLTFVCPPMPPNSGSISFVTNYVRPLLKNTTSAVTLELIEQGFYIVP